mgnify:CR=1 FL=1
MAELCKISQARECIGAARATSTNSANSQVVINFGVNDCLNGQYAVDGMVSSGMEHVDKLTRGEPPTSPDRMISMKVAADDA